MFSKEIEYGHTIKRVNTACLLILLLILIFFGNTVQTYHTGRANNQLGAIQTGEGLNRYQKNRNLTFDSTRQTAQETTARQLHSPIKITGNDNFTNQANQEGWPGSGTKNDPYIITNLTITYGFRSLIDIQNVSLFFSIKYCNLSHGHIGITFRNVTNAQVTQNVITNNEYSGISLSYSYKTELSFNLIVDNSYANIYGIGGEGLSLFNSPNNFIVNNTLVNNAFRFVGENISMCLQKLVVNNTVNNQPLVFWQNTIGGTIAERTGQIVLVNVSRVIVCDQELAEGTIGILLLFCSSLTCYNNSFFKEKGSLFSPISSRVGIEVMFSSELIFHNNRFQNNLAGIRLIYSSDTIIRDNIFSKNFRSGIYIIRSENVTCKMNRISNNIDLGGILLDSSSNNSIILNTINDNDRFGIYLLNSSNNVISQNNLIANNPHGNSQARDDGNTGLANIIRYNYWNNWTIPDNDNDSFVDVPYAIAGDAQNQDLYPRTSPYHVLSQPSLISPTEDVVLSGNITIQWLFSVDLLGHQVTYSVSYSPDNGSSWTTIITSLNQTWYEWDTQTVPDGSAYLILVNATCSEGLWHVAISNHPFTIDNPDPPDLTGIFIVILFIIIVFISFLGYFMYSRSQQRQALRWLNFLHQDHLGLVSITKQAQRMNISAESAHQWLREALASSSVPGLYNAATDLFLSVATLDLWLETFSRIPLESLVVSLGLSLDELEQLLHHLEAVKQGDWIITADHQLQRHMGCHPIRKNFSSFIGDSYSTYWFEHQDP